MTIQVPAAALAVTDYSAPMADAEKERPKIQPQKGDPIDFRIRGSIQAITGGMATVNVAFVNDQRPEMPDQRANLLAEAEEADAQTGAIPPPQFN